MVKLPHNQIIDDISFGCSHLESNFFYDKRILITGASGLIGTYLLAYFNLLGRDKGPRELFVLSRNKLSGVPSYLTLKGGFTSLEIDLSDIQQYSHLPEVDIIIHAAGYAQPSRFMENPTATLTLNTAATLALLKKTDKNGSFLFLSSSEVYCGLEGRNCSEDECGTSTPYHPRASYIEGKRAGEAACAAYRSRGLRTISARLGDIYGPGTRPHDQRALNSFIEQALTTGKIKLRDQGMALRTYSYVTDALENLLNLLIFGREQVYNVSAPNVSSIRDLAILIGDLTGAEVIFPEKNDEIPGAPPALILDISRTKTEFNKINYLSLEHGLTRTIEWQSQLYSYEHRTLE